MPACNFFSKLLDYVDYFKNIFFYLVSSYFDMWNTVSHLVRAAHRLCRVKIGGALGEESIQVCIFFKLLEYADYFKDIFLIKYTKVRTLRCETPSPLSSP